MPKANTQLTDLVAQDGQNIGSVAAPFADLHLSTSIELGTNTFAIDGDGDVTLNNGKLTSNGTAVQAHASFDGNNGPAFSWATDAIASYNVSLVTRTGVGAYTIEFDEDFTAGYSVTVGAGDGGGPLDVTVTNRAIDEVSILVTSAGAPFDSPDYVALAAMGAVDGTPGQAGIKGQKGEEGDASTVAGPKGQKGVDGTAGAKGEPGTNGDKGQKGLDGDGSKGQKGQAGTAAAKGDAGPKGQKGELGTGGTKGEPGTNGAKGQKGIDGSAGTNGDKGQKGATGSAGSAAGADTQVQFNNSNSFAGDAGLTFNSGTDTLTIASQPTISDGLVAVRTGSGNPGAIDLFCEVSNLHRTRLQSGPHAGYTAGQVTLTLPTIPPPNDGDILQGTTAGVLSWVTPTTGGTPGGNNTEIQLNNNGAFAGDSGFTYASNILTVANQPQISDGLIAVRTGSGSAGAIDLFCEVSNVHRTRIQSGPHAGYTGGNVTLTLPTIAPPNAGDVLEAADTAGTLQWVTPATGGLQTRTTATGTTASLADEANGDLNLTMARSYLLMQIETDRAAWVRVYTTAAARTADANRAITTDPAPGSGVIAEVVTTGAATQLMTPGTIGFNNDGTPATTVYLAVQNRSGGTSTVQVTTTFLQLEA